MVSVVADDLDDVGFAAFRCMDLVLRLQQEFRVRVEDARTSRSLDPWA